MNKSYTSDANGESDCGCSTEYGQAVTDNTALQLKALAHPVRLQIMELLRNKEHKCCGDICSCLPLAQSTISQHLELLCRANLVCCQLDGTRSNYSLNAPMIASLADRVAGLSGKAPSTESIEIVEST